MTRDEILARVEELQPWFHCIDLGQGIKTKWRSVADEPSDHPRGTWETIRQCIPEDLTGKSVLDVGCNAGFYAVEAKRRNAARVLGVDSQRHQIRQARFVRRVLGLDVEYRRMSVYDLSPSTVGPFDMTLALGLIYHCQHLIQALANLFLVTRHVLVLETAILPPGNSPASFNYALGGLPRRLHPLAYVENPLDSSEYVFNWFLPTPSSLQAMLRNTGFADVEVFADLGERAVLICRKGEPTLDSRTPRGLAAKLSLHDGPRRTRPSTELRFHVGVENVGSTRWLSRGEAGAPRGAVRLGAHLSRDDSDDEDVVAWDYGRADLPTSLNPGESAIVEMRLEAPAVPGAYYVEFDMVAEHLIWFEDLGLTRTLVCELQGDDRALVA